MLEHEKTIKLESLLRANRNFKRAKLKASSKLTLDRYAKSIVKNTRRVSFCLNFSDLSGSIFSIYGAFFSFMSLSIAFLLIAAIAESEAI
ncbi:hypothetical protein [Acinetobacter johnsonii]|uniref:hypothetical protein n=1 Tax=Acinetobacter johnsonii TaxID=40214 RepID=UPI00300B6CD9